MSDRHIGTVGDNTGTARCTVQGARCQVPRTNKYYAVPVRCTQSTGLLGVQLYCKSRTEAYSILRTPVRYLQEYASRLLQVLNSVTRYHVPVSTMYCTCFEIYTDTKNFNVGRTDTHTNRNYNIVGYQITVTTGTS
jgi:hypothetical protein